MSAPTAEVSELSATLTRATASLRAARRARDLEQTLQIHDAFFGSGLNPRKLLEQATEGERSALRAWHEAWDDVLLRWWLGSKRPQARLVRRLCVPEEGGFAFPTLLLNAWWLRAAGSPRAGRNGLPDPARFGALRFEAQARELARFCLRVDGSQAFDYQAYAAVVNPALRPFLVSWFLRVYLLSPWSNLNEEVSSNRAAATTGFSAIEERVQLPVDPMLTVAAYRSVYFDPSPCRFLSALSDRVIAPALQAHLGDAQPTFVGSKGLGVYLSCFREGNAVQRSLDPMLDTVRLAGVRGFVPPNEVSGLPQAWRQDSVELIELKDTESPSELGTVAAQIQAANLDLLFYPEVGLTLGSRWLSCRRLARVQAVGYGHPVTTGSAEVDYFVGGEAIDRDPSAYRERLVLLPGLGVSISAPLPPSRPRQRANVDDNVLLISAAGFDKLNPPLLRAWGMLLELFPWVRLCLLTGVAQQELPRFTERMRPYLDLERVQTIPKVPRQTCVDLLQEGDVYLDAFPYAGGNSVVEALACGCPVVTLEGRRVYERSGAAIVRQVGLSESLIARTPDDYVSAVTALITDAGHRGALRAQLTSESDLWAMRSKETALHFAEAVRWMREQGPRNPGPPVVIAAGEAPRFLEG